jgi:hypothetical protein
MVRESGARDRPAFSAFVLQHHLQVERQDDHRAAQGNLLEHLPGNAGGEDLGLEQIRVEQRRLALMLAAPEPVDKQHQRSRADGRDRQDPFTAFLPD